MRYTPIITISVDNSIFQVILLYFFQFLTFAERLANVNIDVIHRIDRTGSYAEVCTLKQIQLLILASA